MRRLNVSIWCERILQPTVLNTLKTLDPKSSLQTSTGILTTSKHSLVEYWAFLQHCLFISTTLLLISALTFLTIFVLDLSLTKFLLNLQMSDRGSLFALLQVLTLFWSDKAIPVISLFDNLSSGPSVYAVIGESLVADQNNCRLKSWYDRLTLRHIR